MPKRKMTPARKAAIAKWQRAGSLSRKGKKASLLKSPILDMVRPEIRSQMLIPTGKRTLLWHRTTPNAADSLVREQNWGHSKFAKAKGVSWFTQGKKPSEFYGKALVSVKVPRKMLKVDESMNSYYPPPMRVAIKDLQGRKFRREL